MNALDLQSERFSATGNVASEGVLNQLGRPNLDTLTLLVRETVQNSWDARGADSETVAYGLAGWQLTSPQLQVLHEHIFAHVPPNLGLPALLTPDSEFAVLTVYDRGTTGLGGPTRADVPVGGLERHDFVNFLRNIGQPPEKRFGGGTFGYGKAAVYLASAIRTICVHTHCTMNGVPEARFMAAMLGQQYQIHERGSSDSRFTGRHWWGRRAGRDLVEPLRGREADELAHALGMPPFVDDQSGTTLMILHPVFGEDTPLQAMQVMVRDLLRYFWPKMLAKPGRKPPMIFTASWQGEDVLIPDPRVTPPFQGFVQAMDLLKDAGRMEQKSLLGAVHSIDSQRPKQHLGMLSLQKFRKEQRVRATGDSEETQLPLEEHCHHVALMRQAELVVKYLAGPQLPADQLEYAGVFITDAAVDPVFARAEPPSHDDWVYESLGERRDRTTVRVAVRCITECLESFTAPAPTEYTGVTVVPLGSFATQLGDLLVGSDGSGAAVQPDADGPHSGNRRTGIGTDETGHSGIGGAEGNSGTGGSGKVDLHQAGVPANGNCRTNIRVIGEGTLGLKGDIPAVFIQFEVSHGSRSAGTRVEVHAAVLLDEGRSEVVPPAGEQLPAVLGWEAENGMQWPGSEILDIARTAPTIWVVAVSVPDDALVGVTLSVREIQ